MNAQQTKMTKVCTHRRHIPLQGTREQWTCLIYALCLSPLSLLLLLSLYLSLSLSLSLSIPLSLSLSLTISPISLLAPPRAPPLCCSLSPLTYARGPVAIQRV